MKTWVCATIGGIGGAVAALFGGWDASIETLILFMAIDYISGLLVAGVFHASEKTPGGGLESRAGWKGLCRKGMTLLIGLVGARLDVVTGLTYIRDAVCIAYIANETISITENAGLMGLPLPAIIKRAIDVLQAKADSAAAAVPDPEGQHQETQKGAGNE